MGFVATAGQIRAALSDVRALIVVDDLDLDRHDVETLLDLAPNSTYITAAHQQSMWTSGLTLDLVGLTPADGHKVFEHHLRSVVPAGDAAVVLQFCAAAHGYPMAIVAAAAAVRRGRLTFADLGTISRLDDPATATFEALADSLTNEEQRALAVLDAVEGAALPAEAVTAATNTDSEAVLATLRADGIVQAASPRFRLPRAIAERLELPDWHVETVDGLTSWADHATNPDAVAAAGAAINNSIAWATQNQRSDKGLALARAADRGLALSGRWGLWTEMLSQALTAARTAASRFDEAWVMHQTGTLALCVGDRGTAERELRAAESIRSSIGDHAGLAVTKHNLDVLIGPPPIPQEPQEPPPSPEPTSTPPPSPPPGGGIPGWLWMVFFVILVGGGWGVYQYFQDGEGPPTTNAPPSASFLQVDPERIDFGVVPPLTERALGPAGVIPDDRFAQVFVSNPGEERIDQLDFFLEGRGGFEVINECRPLESGEGCRLIVAFVAIEPGRYEDVLHIDRSADNANYEISVVGTVAEDDSEIEPEAADLVGRIVAFGSTSVRSGEEGGFTYWAIPVLAVVENVGNAPVASEFFVHFEWFNPERGAFEFILADRRPDRSRFLRRRGERHLRQSGLLAPGRADPVGSSNVSGGHARRTNRLCPPPANPEQQPRWPSRGAPPPHNGPR
jgi:hypothetical protein